MYIYCIDIILSVTNSSFCHMTKVTLQKENMFSWLPKNAPPCQLYFHWLYFYITNNTTTMHLIRYDVKNTLKKKYLNIVIQMLFPSLRSNVGPQRRCLSCCGLCRLSPPSAAPSRMALPLDWLVWSQASATWRWTTGTSDSGGLCGERLVGL